jgi:hypothetical protein
MLFPCHVCMHFQHPSAPTIPHTLLGPIQHLPSSTGSPASQQHRTLQLLTQKKEPARTGSTTAMLRVHDKPTCFLPSRKPAQDID